MVKIRLTSNYINFDLNCAIIQYCHYDHALAFPQSLMFNFFLHSVPGSMGPFLSSSLQQERLNIMRPILLNLTRELPY